MASIYDFEAHSLTGQPMPLSQFAGKVLLIVNTASQCGFTPQYKGLQALRSIFRMFQQVVPPLPWVLISEPRIRAPCFEMFRRCPAGRCRAADMAAHSHLARVAKAHAFPFVSHAGSSCVAPVKP